MPRRPLAFILLLALHGLVAGTATVRADGVPVGPPPGDAQLRAAVLPDPAGGAMITYKTAGGLAGAVQVSAAGVPDGGAGFPPVALPFTLEASEPLRVALLALGHVAFASDRSTVSAPALTKLGPGGATDAGFPVGFGMPFVRPALVTGSGGRTLLVAKGSDAVSFWTLRATGEQSQVRLIRDGGTGVWLAWLDQRNDAGDLRYSQLLADGELGSGFTTTGTVLCEAPGAQPDATLAPEGAGGFFAVWRDERSGDADLYARHVLGSGLMAPGWPAQGRPLAGAAGAQHQPVIAALPGGRAIAAWRDARAGTTRIYAALPDDPANTGADPAPATELSLSAFAPAPGQVSVTCSLPQDGEASLELMDVSGRLCAALRHPGPARDRTDLLEPSAPLAPGVYFLRLRQGTAQARTRAGALR